MIGLLAASVWCWAIIVNKTLLFARIRRAMDRFETGFWSGNSLEELYAQLSDAARRPAPPRLFVAAMREWKRSFQNAARLLHGAAGAHRQSARRLDRARGRKARIQSAGARDGRLGRPVRRPVRHGLGHHDGVPLDRRLEEHLARRRRARHRRGAVRHRDRPVRGHSGADRLQQAARRRGQGAGAHGKLRRRILVDPVAPDRPASPATRRPTRRSREPNRWACRSPRDARADGAGAACRATARWPTST